MNNPFFGAMGGGNGFMQMVQQFKMSPMLYSAAPAPVDVFGDSDFLRAVSAVEPSVAWAVMDELMDSLKVVNERVYNSVMRKLDR